MLEFEVVRDYWYQFESTCHLIWECVVVNIGTTTLLTKLLLEDISYYCTKRWTHLYSKTGFPFVKEKRMLCHVRR